MIRRIPVGDVMTRNFVSVSPETNLLECAKKFVKKKIGGIVVSENKRLIGILTQKDILWAITKRPNQSLKEIKAADVATKKVAVIKPSADIAEAFEKMKKYGFKRLPVIAKSEIVGMLTIKDILKIEPAFYAKTGDFFDIREETEKLRRVAHAKGAPVEGLCEECGRLADLMKVNGKLLCNDCREDLY